MPTGTVKIFKPEHGHGFVLASTGEELFVAADQFGEAPSSGAQVEFEVAEDEDGRKRAVDVTVTRAAPPDNPVGRTVTNPPTWEELEERERARRAARRRRR